MQLLTPLKACKPMKIFNPKDSVRVSIKFTKVLYAQLISQEFNPPVGSGFATQPTRGGIRQSKGFIEADVGMKVACGFEMLVASDSVKSVGLLPSPCCKCSPNFLHRPRRKQLQRILEAY